MAESVEYAERRLAMAQMQIRGWDAAVGVILDMAGSRFAHGDEKEARTLRDLAHQLKCHATRSHMQTAENEAGSRYDELAAQTGGSNGK